MSRLENLATPFLLINNVIYSPLWFPIHVLHIWAWLLVSPICFRKGKSFVRSTFPFLLRHRCTWHQCLLFLLLEPAELWSKGPWSRHSLIFALNTFLSLFVRFFEFFNICYNPPAWKDVRGKRGLAFVMTIEDLSQMQSLWNKGLPSLRKVGALTTIIQSIEAVFRADSSGSGGAHAWFGHASLSTKNLANISKTKSFDRSLEVLMRHVIYPSGEILGKSLLIESWPGDNDGVTGTLRSARIIVYYLNRGFTSVVREWISAANRRDGLTSQLGLLAAIDHTYHWRSDGGETYSPSPGKSRIEVLFLLKTSEYLSCLMTS